MDGDLADWLDDWRGRTPRSQVLQEMVESLRRNIEATAEALARPEVDVAIRAKVALELLRGDGELDADDVRSLAEFILGGGQR